jgi:hypothetical protein
MIHRTAQNKPTEKQLLQMCFCWGMNGSILANYFGLLVANLTLEKGFS